MKKTLIAELEGQRLVAPTSLVQTTRLRQIASTTATIWNEDYSGKLDATMDLIEEEPGQIVVATEYRETTLALMSRLAQAGETAGLLIGGQDYGKVQRDFQDGDTRIVVMTRSAGGESLNFGNASLMIILEQPWNPATGKQLEGRVWRPAEEREVPPRIIYLRHKDTIDMQVAKQSLHRQRLTVQALLAILKEQEA